jgi:antitoxin component YwqK of YwqJK toxin-antitoxin module
MGCYIEYNTNGNKETLSNAVDLKRILYSIAMKRFTGIASVYDENKNIVYSMECVDGNLNGQFVKYCTYSPSSVTGYLSGYLSRNWRQPEMQFSLRNGLVDGQVFLYNPDGTKKMLLYFSMGLLQGEQKHYTTSITRILHQYEKGTYISSSKQYKNWLRRWEVELDEIASHKTIKMTSNEIVKMFIK